MHMYIQTQVDAGVCMTDDIIRDALDKLRGAVTIVYPMGLPPHDPIRLEFEGSQDLSGTQVTSRTPLSLWDFKVRGHMLYCVIGRMPHRICLSFFIL